VGVGVFVPAERFNGRGGGLQEMGRKRGEKNPRGLKAGKQPGLKRTG